MDAERRIKELESLVLSQKIIIQKYAGLAAFGHIARNVGHEAGNLVAIVVALSQQIKSQAEASWQDERALDMLGKIDAGGQRLVALMQSQAVCAQGIKHEEKASFAVDDLIERALTLCQPRLRVADVKLRYTPKTTLQMVSVFPGRFVQSVTCMILYATDQVVTSMDRWLAVDVMSADAATHVTVSYGSDKKPETDRSDFELMRDLVTAHGNALTVTDDGSVHLLSLHFA